MKINRNMSQGFAVWITGLPGSGKSVTSEALVDILRKEELSLDLLRMDMMRNIVTPKPKYTDEERSLIYRAFCFVAKKLTENGINVIMDATGNKKKYRDIAREIMEKYMEVFLKCPLEIAISREMQRKDTKEAPNEIYKKAIKGESETIPGLQIEYEEPSNPEMIIESNKIGIDEAAKRIYKKIKNRFL